MNCPDCGQKLGCINSRERGNIRYRTYKCYCGKKIGTTETIGDYQTISRCVSRIIDDSKKNSLEYYGGFRSNA